MKQWVIIKLTLLIVLTLTGFVGINHFLSMTHVLSAQINDLLHLPFFYLITDLLLKTPFKRKPLVLVGLIFFLVVAIELIQPFLGREFSFLDIIFGVLGIAIAILLQAKLFYWAGLVVVVYLLQVSYPIILITKELSSRPVLNDFNSAIDLYRVEALAGYEGVGIKRQEISSLNYVITLELLDYPWSGIRLDQMIAINKEDYRTLQIDFNNQKQAEILDLRLDGSNDKCILSSPPLNVGVQRIVYDLSKCDELKTVSRIALYFETDKLQDGYWFNNIKLIEVNK